MKSKVKSLINFVLPYSLVISLRFELKILRSRILNFLNPFYHMKANKLSKTKGAKIHLGSGPNYLNGWINIDGISRYKSDLVVDLRRSIPLKDKLASAIFCEHFVEHLEYPMGVHEFFKECYRLLQDGAPIRISVPDARLYLEKYQQNDKEFFLRERPGCETHMEAINHVFRQAGQHQWAYDFENLKLIMEKAGFVEVAQRKYGESSIQGFSGDSEKRSGESLYIEARRPQGLQSTKVA